jgi:hypothetical protein
MVRPLTGPSRRKVPLGVVVVAAAIAVPLLITLNPLAGSGAANVTATSRASTASTEQLQAALSILRRPRTARDELPATLQNALAALHAGADPGQARRAFVMADGVAVYLVPSERGICLIDSNLSENGCFAATDVLGSGATQSDVCSPTLPDGNTIEIAGIVPDGAIDPTVILSDGRRQALEVRQNAYLMQFDRKGPLPRQIEWTAATGPTTVSADVPADVASEQCATRSELRALEASGKIPTAPGRPPAEPAQHIEYNNG